MDFLEYLLESIFSIIAIINFYMWGNILVYALLAVGVFFTIRTKFFQFRMLGHSFSLLKKKHSSENKSANSPHISSFQALSTSLASIVGVGSIAGMAVAISTGGPGTIFWVWVIALVGMATSVVEHTLGQVYKTKKTTSSMFMGGPSYYLLYGLKNKFLSYTFSILLIVTFGIAFNTLQANTIGGSFKNAFNIEPYITGIILTVITFLVIFGGIKRIATISSFLVPIMGLVYLGLALTIIILNIKEIPAVIVLIVKSAFGFGEVVAGGTTYLFLQTAIIGIKRALFSTETGMGSAPNITASADVSHPTQQGILGMLGVFLVAFIICNATAFIILLSGTSGTQLQGVELVQNSLKNHLGEISVYILSGCVFIFGFTSVIGNYSYAENNIGFLTKSKFAIPLIRVFVLGAVFAGSLLKLSYVWDMADLFMGAMVLINLYALLMLSNVAIKTINDYTTQHRANKKPIFSKDTIESLKNDKHNVW